LQFRQAALDGLAMAIEQASDEADAAVSEFESFIGGIKSPLTFIERGISNEHGLFDARRIRV
jgi:hypothetical protein